MIRIFFALILTGLTHRATSSEFSDWISENRDQEGCVKLSAFNLKKGEACPQKFNVPDVRPMVQGTLNKAKTQQRARAEGELCCYDWKTLGNR